MNSRHSHMQFERVFSPFVLMTMSSSLPDTSTMKGRDKKDTETPKRGASKKDALIGIVL